ncbi:hypothetical protein BC831DRAFT_454296 [Entophlyctis helioformis]|nr:hypothetical protein BC831DRAFT_454296 [Entophlyctis helioformis]
MSLLRSAAQTALRTHTHTRTLTRTQLPVLAAATARRTLYLPAPVVLPRLTKFQVDEQVLTLLHDYANVDESQVKLHSNLVLGLLVDSLDRYGLYVDLVEKFMLIVDDERRFTRDFKSGREAADWVAALMEEDGRLVY